MPFTVHFSAFCGHREKLWSITYSTNFIQGDPTLYTLECWLSICDDGDLTVLKYRHVAWESISEKCDLVGVLRIASLRSGGETRRGWALVRPKLEGTAWGSPVTGGSERARDSGAGACGKHGLVPTLWRCYRGCSRKSPQRCSTVCAGFHPSWRNKALKEQSCSSCFEFFWLIILGRTFRVGKSHRV